MSSRGESAASATIADPNSVDAAAVARKSLYAGRLSACAVWMSTARKVWFPSRWLKVVARKLPAASTSGTWRSPSMTDTSATLALMQRSGRVTLDRWLALNACDPSAPVDAELLEIVPEPLREELDDRLRMQSENLQ